ncbi:MAG: aminotransferase class V-fold PLP-dependent enzyme [Microthrixaceae bacterium]|nr:aminotransferase class V-fold PLP-dependent enzyme [Microthrixaceae bacterium]
MTSLPQALVGDETAVPCVDGTERRYVALDSAASTGALPAVADAVAAFLPNYSSVHRGAGFKSQYSTEAYENARRAAERFAGRDDTDDVAVLCRNTTEAINHLAYRLRFSAQDVVLTTVVEHHANLLPWGRVAARREWIECSPDGTFTVEEVERRIEQCRPALLAITGATNVTGWLPPIDKIIEAAHQHGTRVLIDAAQLAPHRPLPTKADFLAWSGHKMYAPFGTGVLVGPRDAFTEGDPFLAGGGAVDLVDLDEVLWTDPPEREEAGSPNVVGAVALGAAIEALESYGWDAIIEHERALAARLRGGLAAIDGVRLLGPSLDVATLAVAAFTLDDLPHALVAARLSAEYGIGVRHGCFCAHPYLVRLLGLSEGEIDRYRRNVVAGDRRGIPGAVRASAGITTTPEDIDVLLNAVAELASGRPAPVEYRQDSVTGDWWPISDEPWWASPERSTGAACARG